MKLSSDRPNVDVKGDLFGYAPFAENLAKSICQSNIEDGLVLSIHGPWGSGKTTILEYICHYIEIYGKEQEDTPIIVRYNPWWFSGRDDLAQAFLRQLQIVLPSKSEKLKQVGELISDFAESIGGILDLAGLAGGCGGAVGKVISQVVKKSPKEVPAIKEDITKILREAKIRILVVIDDIDRLDNDEVRQLFMVIKALADFPFVTYLLAFDQEVASQAIERGSGLPGDRYLEKIIQVPFEIPPIDRIALSSALFKKLDDLLIGTQEELFDQAYWINVFYEGIDPLIRVPRDIVRLTNTISVTYHAVLNEVNPVDFIAIESLRVFLPSLYNLIRSNKDKFAGHSPEHRHGRDREESQAFHETWVSALPQELQESTRALIERLFPKTSNSGFGADWLKHWRKELRICHPDIFPVYFRLSLQSGSVSHLEMIELVNAADDPEKFKKVLLQAKSIKRNDGLSKAREYLERLMDYIDKEIQLKSIPLIISAFVDIGDELIIPTDETGMFDFGNVPRVTRPIYHLLKRVDEKNRAEILETAFNSSDGVYIQLYLIDLLKEINDKSKNGEQGLIPDEKVDHLQSIWLENIRRFSSEPNFISHANLHALLSKWNNFGNENEVRNWCNTALQNDEQLLKLIFSFLQRKKTNTMGDWAIKYSLRLNPSWLEPYIDINICAERLTKISEEARAPKWAEDAVAQFLKEYQLLQEGKDPDTLLQFGDAN